MDRKLFDNAALKRLIIPLVIEQFLAVFMGMMDMIMVSSCGEAAISGVKMCIRDRYEGKRCRLWKCQSPG